MTYLNQADLIRINKAQGERGTILKQEAVTMATQQIGAKVYGADLRPTFAAKAAYLARAIARHHMFEDGNKRTALAATVEFLRLNGIIADNKYIEGEGDMPLTNYNMREWINKIVDASEDGLDNVVGNFAVWLRKFVTLEKPSEQS
jgi:death-on-curing protein